MIKFRQYLYQVEDNDLNFLFEIENIVKFNLQMYQVFLVE